MAWLRRRRIAGHEYLYIVTSKNIKNSGNVKQVTLEYLGRDPDPKRLKRALVYWGVKAKRRRR